MSTTASATVSTTVTSGSQPPQALLAHQQPPVLLAHQQLHKVPAAPRTSGNHQPVTALPKQRVVLRSSMMPLPTLVVPVTQAVMAAVTLLPSARPVSNQANG